MGFRGLGYEEGVPCLRKLPRDIGPGFSVQEGLFKLHPSPFALTLDPMGLGFRL